MPVLFHNQPYNKGSENLVLDQFLLAETESDFKLPFSFGSEN